MDDQSVLLSDELEKALQQRIAEVYGEALKRAIRNNRLFLTNVQKLDARAEELQKTGWTNEKIEKWRKEEVLRLLRQQRLVQNIANEMDKAGIAIAPEIKDRMVDVYKVNSDATYQYINGKIGANFAMVPRKQIPIILNDTQPVFAKIAYKHLGNNRTIRDALQREMAQAAILGESQDKIVRRIQRVTGQAEYQARRVAQTERNRIQSQARAEALHEAAQLGVRVTKTWSTRMVNSRDSHVALDGKTINEDESWHTIWGNDLRYPGDPNAPAREVINCHCVMIPDVAEDAAKPPERLKKDPESGIIKGGKTQAGSRQKAEEIEKAFRYVDDWGDTHSPIDVQAFAAMPEDAQEQAADGIRTAMELLRLDKLPNKITFGSARGAYGEYSETTRTLTLSRTKCKDPAEARSTMIHELTHYYDQVSGHIAEKVYKQAIKELGLSVRSKEAKRLLLLLVGTKYKEKDRIPESLAFAVELSQKGTNDKLAKKIFEIIMR